MSLTYLNEHEPLALTIGDFCRAVGLGRSTVYGLIDKGELESIKGRLPATDPVPGRQRSAGAVEGQAGGSGVTEGSR
jgi:hypothetical protein